VELGDESGVVEPDVIVHAGVYISVLGRGSAILWCRIQSMVVIACLGLFQCLPSGSGSKSGQICRVFCISLFVSIQGKYSNLFAISAF
jgi:hypothetical protein